MVRPALVLARADSRGLGLLYAAESVGGTDLNRSVYPLGGVDVSYTVSGLPVGIVAFFLLYALIPLLAIALGLAIFFLGRRYVRNKYGKH